MNIAELVFAALANGSDGLRAHHEKLPAKGTPSYILPMLVITTVAGSDDVDLRGDASLHHRLMQLDAWGASRKLADDYMELARLKMLSATTFGVGAIDVSGGGGYDEEANLFRASLEFRVWFNQ